MISCLRHAPNWDLACALTGNPTCNLLVCRQTLNPRSHISQVGTKVFNGSFHSCTWPHVFYSFCPRTNSLVELCLFSLILRTTHIGHLGLCQALPNQLGDFGEVPMYSLKLIVNYSCFLKLFFSYFTYGNFSLVIFPLSFLLTLLSSHFSFYFSF